MHVKCRGCFLCELIPARWRREPLFCPLISGARQSSSSAPSRYLWRHPTAHVAAADAGERLVRATVQVRGCYWDAKFSSETNGSWRDDAQI